MTDPQEPHVAEDRSAGGLAQARSVTAIGPVVTTKQTRSALRLIGLSYRAGACAVRNVDVSIELGQSVALAGPVGAGKTTLLRVIAGVHAPCAGRVHFGVDDVTGWDPERRQIAWVPQGAGLLPDLTVRKQLEFPLAARGEKLDQAADVAEQWQLSDLLEHRPNQLSGGERQLVALARATVFRPRLLLLDEPFSALSDDQRSTASKRLRQWQDQGPPMVTIHASHQVDQVDQPAAIWKLQDGRLRATPIDG